MFRAGDDVHARLRAEVLAGDPERAEAAVFATEAIARRLIALYAFNLEVAKAWESVSEPALGLIRLQWWREALDQAKAGETVRRHDGAEGLAEIVGFAPDLAPILERLIDAREKDFDETPFADVLAYRAYVDATAGGVIEAALRLADADMDDGARLGLARPLGRAWGTVGLLRALPFHLSKRRLSAPLGDLDAEAVFSGAEKEAVRALKDKLLVQVREDHRAAAAAFKALSPEARPAALYGALIPKLAGKLSPADPFQDMVALGPLARKAALTFAALTGRI